MAQPSISAILVLDSSDGTRLHSKYFDKVLKDSTSQLAFESNLFSKCRSQLGKSETEIVLLDNTICVYRSAHDVTFFVVGLASENEIVLASVLECLYEALNGILRSQMEKRVLLDNLEILLLAVDEVVDGGHILEVDPTAVANRVLMKGAEGGETPASADLTFTQAWASAKEQLSRQFRG